MSITKQNTFHRSLANEAKMGAYYTDLAHSQWINNLLEFPEEEVCALEPSIGDGKAIKTVANKEVNKNVKIFGVELNRKTEELLKTDGEIEKTLCADFLNGIKVSNSAFSFCFSNPPYGMDTTREKPCRLERSFLEKLTFYLKSGAVLVYVIPFSVFSDEDFLKVWCSRYSTKCVYKFHEEEFAKWKQIVVIGTKKNSNGYARSEFEEILRRYTILEMLEELPVDYQGEKIKVKPSSSGNIEYFSSQIFNSDIARSKLSKSSLHRICTAKIEQKEYVSSELSRPPIPMKMDLMYLLSVSGGGEGKAGSEENGDLHLQRGVVKVVESTTIEGDDDSNVLYQKVRSASSINVTIIENDGRITHLT